jgi:hypothetical protein
MSGLKISSYDPVDMSLLSADATGLDFGDVVRGQYCAKAVTVRPVADGVTFTSLALFLESADGLNHTQFGKFKSNTAITGVEPGSAYLSDFFIPVTGVSDVSTIGAYSDYGVVYNGATPEYTWMDAFVDTPETVFGDSTVNFRFVFEYF